MWSLYNACDQISGSGVFDYSIGNNIVSIEAFNSIESYEQLGDSTSQDNIVLIKSETIYIMPGKTLTVKNPKKSLVLFCDTLINDGTISMTGKGPNTLPHDYYIVYEDTIFEDVIIPAYANNRIERTYISAQPGNFSGINGLDGTNRQCGSGGQGCTTAGNSGMTTKCLGATGSGYAFGGGAGAGGKSGDSNYSYESNVDVDSTYPMRGAPGFSYTYYGASGGVGNPSGSGQYNALYNYPTYGAVPTPDQNLGVGGRIIIFCNTLINNGTIEANGVKAYRSAMYYSSSGGSSGGGAVDIFYFNSYQQGTITVNGGAIESLCPDNAGVYGGRGGNGSVVISKLNYEISLDGSMANNNLFTFEYTGKTEAIDLIPGVYNFYCKGAQGNDSNAELGGVTKATIAILEPKTFYVSVGQQAVDNTGGWNGGRNAISGFGGGGATDIAVQGIDQSTDWYTTLHLSSRIMIAKGGSSKIITSAIKTASGNTYSDLNVRTLLTFTASHADTLNFSCASYTGRHYGYIYDDETGALLSSGIDYFNLTVSTVVGKRYRLAIRAHCSSHYGYCEWRASYPELKEVIRGEGGGLNYIYTQDTKDSYPENPCNTESYYMTKPEVILDAPNIVKDGLAYIQRIGRFIFEYPYLKDIYYYYTGSEQTALIEQIEEDKVNIANNKKINAGLYNISITPKIGYYWTSGTNSELKLQWRILKADPQVTWPTPTMLDIDSQINKSRLLKGVGNGEFTWSDGSLKMKYPNSGYEAVFTPLDLSNYNIIKKKLSIRAIFLRNNSNLHKDSQQQDFMDFNKILNLMEVKQ